MLKTVKCLLSYPVEQGIQIFVGTFIYFYMLCLGAVKALVRLCVCAALSEP